MQVPVLPPFPKLLEDPPALPIALTTSCTLLGCSGPSNMYSLRLDPTLTAPLPSPPFPSQHRLEIHHITRYQRTHITFISHPKHAPGVSGIHTSEFLQRPSTSILPSISISISISSSAFVQLQPLLSTSPAPHLVAQSSSKVRFRGLFREREKRWVRFHLSPRLDPGCQVVV